MQGHLPPAAQEQYEKMQDLQEEAEAVVAERERAESRLEDAEAALEALEDVDDGETVYRAVGDVRVATDAGDAAPALEETAERLEDRIEDLEAEEQKLREQFENRKQDIKHLLGGAAGDPTSPGTGN